MGGVIITIWANQRTESHRISQTRCCLVLVGRVGGLLFDGRRFCTEVSFARAVGNGSDFLT